MTRSLYNIASNKHYENKLVKIYTCVDPERFARGDLTSFFCLLFFFCFVLFFSGWGEGGFKYHYKRAIIGPPAQRHLNDVLLACR